MQFPKMIKLKGPPSPLVLSNWQQFRTRTDRSMQTKVGHVNKSYCDVNRHTKNIHGHFLDASTPTSLIQNVILIKVSRLYSVKSTPSKSFPDAKASLVKMRDHKTSQPSQPLTEISDREAFGSETTRQVCVPVNHVPCTLIKWRDHYHNILHYSVLQSLISPSCRRVYCFFY